MNKQEYPRDSVARLQRLVQEYYKNRNTYDPIAGHQSNTVLSDQDIKAIVEVVTYLDPHEI